MLRQALAEGWTPELIVIELKDWEPNFFAGLKGEAEREAVFAAFRELAVDRQLVFFDNSAIGQEGRDGLRASTPAMQRLVEQLRDTGFVVLEPSDQLLRELMRESPWGNQTYRPGERHGAAWAIDATARVLATGIYPKLRARLEGGGQP